MWDAVAIIVLAMLFLPVHSWIYGTSLLNISEKSSAAASSLSYDIQRRETAPVHSEEIVLVDISDFYGATARAEVADLLDAIYAMEPKRIGVDIFFPASRTTDNAIATEIDSILAETAHNIADKTVFVCHLDSFDSDQQAFKHVYHSFFFDDSYGDETMEEGYDNLIQSNPGEAISKYSIMQRAEGKNVWSFPTQIAAEYLEDTLDNEPIIRFDPTDFTCLTPDQLEPDSIFDRIVLVGDMRGRNDSHLTPLGMMQGVELHAYAVQSILHYNRVIHAPVWLLWLISLAVCFLYLMILFIIDYKLDVYSNNMLKFAIKQGMFTLAATYIITIILEYIAYISFTMYDTTLGLHAVLPDLIKLLGFTKVTYSILVPLLYKRFGWKWLRYSCLVEEMAPTSQTTSTNPSTSNPLTTQNNQKPT